MSRREHDSAANVEVPNHAYYGVRRFGPSKLPFSGIRVCHYEHSSGVACVKRAAALANAELGVLDHKIADAIATACDEIFAESCTSVRRGHDQGGAGTSTKHVRQRVIANAHSNCSAREGEYQFCHPNDHVNCSQFPTNEPIHGHQAGVWSLARHLSRLAN